MKGIADYTFVREFPMGNHGRVFMAHTPARLGLEAPHVAVKVLASNATDTAFERLATELHVLATVASPFLVAVHDAGHEDGLLYYAMEYFPDGSLGIRRRAFARGEVLQAVAHAAWATQDLHDAGVVHADIKPNNILLWRRGAKLADLGLARVVGQDPGDRVPIGSIEYMDPQVVSGEPPEPASDVWALGATLHWALTRSGLYGRVPTSSLLEALRHVATRPPQLADGLSPQEAELIAACVTPDRDDRPSASDVAEQAERLAAARDG